MFWTGSKNAFIELIYALYANGSLSYGKIGIRKISLVLERLFRITLGDLHNSFHRMKYRAGSRTSFLDQLKSSLEEYMDNNKFCIFDMS
ncbi:RteC domain-containing protein [Sphingobacterium siyangense]